MERINPADYLETLRAMVTGQSWKIQHKGCSESKALSVKMDVEGYLFHCFKCGASAFLPHEDSTFRDRKRREAEKAAYQAERMKNDFNLPADFTTDIPAEGLAWLGKGGWGSDMIFKHGAGWSARLGRVVFKVEPFGYIARAVYPDQTPKYLSKTPGAAWWCSEPITDRVCLTEDILSAGKVGQLYPAMAMLGTDSLNLDIASKCKQLLIWTDNDAGGEKARRFVRGKLQWLPRLQILDIKAGRDPKYYTADEIRLKLLRGGARV